MRYPRAGVALIAVVLAAASGVVRAGDDRRAQCEDRCDDRMYECESNAEAKADECSRKIESDSDYELCQCGEFIDGKRSLPCEKTCAKAGKSAEKCRAKLQRALERCEEHEAVCFDKCSD